MNDQPVTRLVYDAYRVCANTAKQAGRVIVKAGWSLNRDDAWDLLDELSENPKATLEQRMMKTRAEHDGLHEVISTLGLCGWPVIIIGEGPTTIAIVTDPKD